MLTRDDAIRALDGEPFDVLVIGGGITGAGVALDAATRGYSVALVERGDFAIGTSSRSSKLVHGGLRYLQNFDLGLVREALLERQINVALAPHLVKPLPLIVPAFDGARPDRLVGLGLNMYDVMAVDRISPLGRRRDRNRDGVEDWSPARHRVISGEEVAELLPALASRRAERRLPLLRLPDRRRAARADRARRGRALRRGRGQRRRGARAAGGGRARGRRAPARRGERARSSTVRAANVVNATGVWADRLRPEELHDEAEVPVIRPSRGTHIIVAGATLPLVAGAIAPAGGGRTIFVLPWLGQTLIGTTDNDYEGDLQHVQPALEDVDYLLEATNAFFGSELTPGDVAGAYAGVRPLISTGDPKKSVDISRKAELYETSSGMVTITGGKLTTWRRMAKMTVDRIVEREGRDAPCRTDKVPLGMAVEAADLPHVPGVAAEAYEQLAGRYGYAAHEVLRIAGERPELAAPVVEGRVDLLAEAAYAARREQARTVADVLLRRTRLGLTAGRAVTADGGAAGRVAAAMAAEHGWDGARTEREAAAFADEAAAEGIVVS